MTDYSTLKVVDLKKVLKDRGLPVSGNKADLVKRLQDADEVETEAEAVPELPTTKTTAVQTPVQHESAAQAAPPLAPPIEQENIPQTTSIPDAAVQASASPAHITIEKIAKPVIETPAEENGQTDNADPVDDKLEAQPTQPEAPVVSEAEAIDARIETEAVATDLQVAGATKEDLQAVRGPSPISREATQIDQLRRRKRSSTPLPDENDVHKKLRTASGAVKVTLPEDAEARGRSEQGYQSISHAPEQATDGHENEPTANAPKTVEHEKPQGPGDRDEEVEQQHAPHREQHETHLTASSRHLATSTLYISNLKRPLQPLGLRKHLDALAGGEGTDNTRLLIDFFLDTLRTHCFARFESAASASRVRDKLHETAWPDEKSRERLWVDFIPEGKFDDWVKLEEQSSGPKKWKVEYETNKDGTTAILIDASAPQTRPEPIKVRPSKSAEEPKASPRDDRAKGFKTLDDLFSSTKAKPKLYYLPVGASIVDRRLQKLAAGRGGGRGEGHARYTFEDGDRLVNDGPDNGLALDRNRGFVGGASRPARMQDRRPYDHYRH